MTGEPVPPPGRPSGMVGQRIAGYLLECEIGRGGTATVYRARDMRLGRRVAVKLLAPELARNDTFRKRFVHESQAAAAIDHPHIIPVYEAGEAENVLFIAMRYVKGRDLRALLDREGRLSVERACRIAVQVASALDAAHAHDLVHRDVKPGNILVAEGTDSDRPEHVYLTDFGLTKKSLSLTGFTTVGQFVGTVDYVAPEQISGKPVDGRCDVYSLGCVVFEALAGAPPYPREDDLAVLWAHLYEPPPTLTALRPDLPAAADEVIARALAKAPDDRYDSCAHFVAALRGSVRSPRQPGQPGAEPGGPDHAPTQVVRDQAALAPEPAPPPAPPPWAMPVFTSGPIRRSGPSAP